MRTQPRRPAPWLHLDLHVMAGRYKTEEGCTGLTLELIDLLHGVWIPLLLEVLAG